MRAFKGKQKDINWLIKRSLSAATGTLSSSLTSEIYERCLKQPLYCAFSIGPTETPGQISAISLMLRSVRLPGGIAKRYSSPVSFCSKNVLLFQGAITSILSRSYPQIAGKSVNLT